MGAGRPRKMLKAVLGKSNRQDLPRPLAAAATTAGGPFAVHATVEGPCMEVAGDNITLRHSDG